MKIVVIGGTGLIGSKLVNKLKALGHEALAASPSTGVNIITGEGLAEILKDTNVVVDVANSPSFEDQAVLKFFETSSQNILKAEKATGVGHHIALSIVGTDLVPESGYLRAKLAQENLIKASPIPYTIVRSTQFFEFLNSIAQAGTVGQTVHLPKAFLQPIAAEDVAAALLKVVLEKPVNGIIEIAGPEKFPFSEIVGQYLQATGDTRKVFADANSTYFGAKLNENMIVPQKKYPLRLGKIDFKSWFESQSKTKIAI
jgi:uncharacterized protein YbjT (DUF2867 family)